eukprot:10722459-Alexandrium_andersonii.AAC.1
MDMLKRSNRLAPNPRMEVSQLQAVFTKFIEEHKSRDMIQLLAPIDVPNAWKMAPKCSQLYQFYSLFKDIVLTEPKAIISHKKTCIAIQAVDETEGCLLTREPKDLVAARLSSAIRAQLAKLRQMKADPRQRAIALAKAPSDLKQ